MIISAGMEIYAVLLILVAEIFSSSYHLRWINPKKKYNGKKITWTKEYFEKEGKRYPHYVGIGRILYAILIDAEEIFEIPNSISNQWKMLLGNYEFEKPKIKLITTIPGSAEDNQLEIEKLKKYPNVKIWGFVLLFLAFIIQLIYSIIIFINKPYY